MYVSSRPRGQVVGTNIYYGLTSKQRIGFRHLHPGIAEAARLRQRSEAKHQNSDDPGVSDLQICVA
jgi:hypothetical protein